jgi:hypothetical protein
VHDIGPRTLLRIPVFVAALVALGVTLAGRLAWTAWPFELVTNFPVQLAVVSVVVVAAAIFLRARVTIAVAGLALVVNLIVMVGVSAATRGSAADRGTGRFQRAEPVEWSASR